MNDITYTFRNKDPCMNYANFIKINDGHVKFTKIKWLLELRKRWLYFKYKYLGLIPDNSRIMVWNVYNGKDINTFNKKFNIIHYVIKYKIMVPLIKVIKYKFKKILEEPIKNEPMNKNLIAFENAFEQTKKDWIIKWNINLDDAELKKFGGYDNYVQQAFKIQFETLDTLKNLVKIICVNDTAYKEFMNILLINITKEIEKTYPKGKGMKHILYTGHNVHDFRYYAMVNSIDEAGEYLVYREGGNLYAKRI